MTAELCATHPDPDLWWREDDIDEAWRICRRCPALDAGCERGQEIALLEGVGFMRSDFSAPKPVEVEHGRGRYTAGCRCPRCAEANRLYVERWRKGGLSHPRKAQSQQLTFDLEAS